jgi:hypothetical protein
MALATIFSSKEIFEGLDRSARIADEQMEVTIAQLESAESIAAEMAKTANLYAVLLVGLETSLNQMADATREWSSALNNFADDAENIGNTAKDAASYLPIKVPTGVAPKWNSTTVAGITIKYPVDLKITFTTYLTKEKQNLIKVGNDLKNAKKTLNQTAGKLSGVATFLKGDTVPNISSSTVQTLNASAENLKRLAEKRIPAVRKGLEGEKAALDDMRQGFATFKWSLTLASALLALFFLHSLNGARICRTIADKTDLV